MKRLGNLVVLVAVLSVCSPLIAAQEAQTQEKAASVKIGYGWSIKDGVKEAVKEAISSVNSHLGKTRSDYALLFSTVGYDSEDVLKQVKKQFGSGVKIYGATSCLGVMTKDGFHVGEVGSLAIMAISSDKISFGVGGANLDQAASPRQAAKQAIIAAIKDAGKSEKDIPNLVLITAAPGKEEEILLGIADVIGKRVPVIGGSSADNTIEGFWRQYANDQVYSNGLALTAIYTDLTLGIAFQSEYYRTIKRGTVTRAEGRVIYEINGKPAAEVYNRWLGGKLSEVLKTGGTILSRTTFYPLAKVIKGEGGETHYLSIHPLSFDLPAKSLTVFADMKTGDKIQLMRGNWEQLLNRTRRTSLQALRNGGLLAEDVGFGIFTFCAGTMLAIPREEMPKMPLLINNAIGGAPFIGTFTFGEQGYLAGVGNRHGNLVNSMIVFNKELSLRKSSP